jgi:hypothetical protein
MSTQLMVQTQKTAAFRSWVFNIIMGSLCCWESSANVALPWQYLLLVTGFIPAIGHMPCRSGYRRAGGSRRCFCASEKELGLGVNRIDSFYSSFPYFWDCSHHVNRPIQE